MCNLSSINRAASVPYKSKVSICKGIIFKYVSGFASNVYSISYIYTTRSFYSLFVYSFEIKGKYMENKSIPNNDTGRQHDDDC